MVLPVEMRTSISRTGSAIGFLRDPRHALRQQADAVGEDGAIVARQRLLGRRLKPCMALQIA